MWLYLHQLWLIVINLQYPAINQTKKGNCFNSNILYSSLLFQTFLQKYIIKILLMTSCLINTKQNGNVSKYQVFFPTPFLTLRTMKIWIPLPAGNGGKKVVWALIYGQRLETCLIYGFRLGFDWKRLRPNISGCTRTGHNYYYFVSWRRVSKWKIKLRPGLIFQCGKVSFFFFGNLPVRWTMTSSHRCSKQKPFTSLYTVCSASSTSDHRRPLHSQVYTSLPRSKKGLNDTLLRNIIILKSTQMKSGRVPLCLDLSC